MQRGSKLKYDVAYIFEEECPIPKHWVLTVRKCECGQTLFWDGTDWHCMKETCPLHNSHEGEFNVSEKSIVKICDMMKTETPLSIASKLGINLSTVVKVIKYYVEKDVFRVLREHDIM